MVTGNFKIALDSIKSSKLHSFLTMLGIIVGVMSVVTIVSIGEGVKQQVTNEITNLGPDLLTIRPGKAVTRDAKGNVSGVNFTAALSGNSLTENDLRLVQTTPDVAAAVPLSLVTATPSVDGQTVDQTLVFGTTPSLPTVLKHKVEYGAFFGESDDRKNVAVVGPRVAEQLFKETVPIGHSLDIRGQHFIVVGVFEEFQSATLPSTTDYNSAVFIPLNKGKQLSGEQSNIQQIFVKPTSPDKTDKLVASLHSQLQRAHGGQDDFTVLKQEDNLAIANSILNLLTGFTSGIAAISLIVGGIGIMNIMLVSVTERNKEIGIRKAVGATNHQILWQFLIEAVVISFVGGLIGIAGSVLANFFIRIFTDLQPIVTLPIMLVAVLVAVLVGVVFGVAPALRAARKDPIEALRRT